MGAFHGYPYTNFHDLNLDWVIELLKKFETELTQFGALNTIKYANPFQWDITRQYAQNTLVIDPETGTAYLSVQPVPQGVQITNTEYWTPVADISHILQQIIDAITSSQYYNFGLPATKKIEIGELVWINDKLYICKSVVDEGQNITVSAFEYTNLDAEFQRLVNQNNDAIQTAVNQNKDAIQTAVATLNSRISNIIANGQQTEGNTELIDIRTWWNGNKSTIAGEAVREQIKTALHSYNSLFASDATTPEKYKNLNDLEANTIYGYNGVTVSNGPFSMLTGLVVTLGYSITSLNVTQIYIPFTLPTSPIRARQYYQSKWSEWRSLEPSNESLNSFHVGGNFPDYSNSISGVPIQYQDFNSIPGNTFVLYGSVYGDTYPKNAPFDPFNGCVLTFAPTTKNTAARLGFQIAIDSKGSQLYFRSKWGNGYVGAWHSVYEENDTNGTTIDMFVDGGDGQYHYSSVIECFKAAQKIQGFKTIHISSGTYNIYNELGGNSYMDKIEPDATATEVQPFLDNVHVIGYGDVILNLDIPTSIPQEKRFLFSPLNVRGNFTIENLTCIANNARYAVHDESRSKYPNTKHVYKNIKAISTGTSQQAIGCGYSDGTIVELYSCVITKHGGEAYSYHCKKGCNILFDNCIIDGHVRFSQEVNYKNNVKMNNCFIANKKIVLRPEYDYGGTHICMTNVFMINTKVDTILTEQFGFSYDSIDSSVEMNSYNTVDSTKSDKKPVI